MSSKDEFDDESGEGGKGGQSGQIQFRDFLTPTGSSRDDELSAEDKKHLLAIHKDTHEAIVKRQKDLRDQRKDLKNGKISLVNYRASIGASNIGSQFKANPILADKAQFSGIDRQVNALPTVNDPANKAEQHELRLSLDYKLRAAPKFNPKPQPR